MNIEPIFTKVVIIPDELNKTITELQEMDEGTLKEFVEKLRLHFVQLHSSRHPVFSTNKDKQDIIRDLNELTSSNLEDITRKYYTKQRTNVLFEEEEERLNRISNEIDSELNLTYNTKNSNSINHWFPEIWDTKVNSGKAVTDQFFDPLDFFRNVRDLVIKDRFKIGRENPNAKLSEFLITGLRIVNGNQPVYNFPSTLAAWIYYNKAKRTEPSEYFNILDTSCGWAGRYLGALTCASQPDMFEKFSKLRYFGTDPNESVHDRFEMFEGFWNEYIARNVIPVELYKSVLPAEDLLQDETFEKLQGQFDIMFTSPPYFNKEMYSNDRGQSYKTYDNNYDQWRTGFLEKMLKNTYDLLKVGGECWINIADVKYKGSKYLPLEKDTIYFAKKSGFDHVKTYRMIFGIMPGLDKKSDANKKIDNDKKTMTLDMITNNRIKIREKIDELKATVDNLDSVERELNDLRAEYRLLGRKIQELKMKKNKGNNSDENPVTKNTIEINDKKFKYEPIFVFKKI